jgi:hypothetical protein
MSLPLILKSKAFWTFSTVTGSISSFVAYDRYQCRILRDYYLEVAAEYGRQPLPHHQSPRCISIFLISKNVVHHKPLRDTFKSFALDILTNAGVDYKWVVEVDGEEAGKWWDEGAREANKPELMLDDSKKTIDLIALNENVLEFELNEKSGLKNNELNVSATEFLWQIIRKKACSIDWPPTSDGFLALDPFTYTSLQSKLKQLADEAPVLKVNTLLKKSSWFWSKSIQTPVDTIPSLFPVPLYFIPCEYPQNAFARLYRFLFGQRHLTRSIGDNLLSLIREQPAVLITKQPQ